MAENPKETPTYGVYEELDAAEAPEYAGNLEREVCDWIEAVSGMPRGDEASVHDWLKDGSVLCAVVNAIQPGTITKVNTSELVSDSEQKENITYFMSTACNWGVPDSSMFDIADLYENKDMGSVISAIYAFGGAVQAHFPEFDGPKLGIAHAAQASDTKREKKVATQSGGLSGTLEQQSAHTAARQAKELAAGEQSAQLPVGACPERADRAGEGAHEHRAVGEGSASSGGTIQTNAQMLTKVIEIHSRRGKFAVKLNPSYAREAHPGEHVGIEVANPGDFIVANKSNPNDQYLMRAEAVNTKLKLARPRDIHERPDLQEQGFMEYDAAGPFYSVVQAPAELVGQQYLAHWGDTLTIQEGDWFVVANENAYGDGIAEVYSMSAERFNSLYQLVAQDNNSDSD